MSNTDSQPEAPFAEAELRAARAQIAVRDFTDSMTRFVQAWEESVRLEMARFEAARKRAAEQAAERQKRVDAAVQWIRSQEGPTP